MLSTIQIVITLIDLYRGNQVTPELSLIFQIYFSPRNDCRPSAPCNLVERFTCRFKRKFL